MSIVPRNVTGSSPKKSEAIAKLRKGKITVPQAAKLAGVPISGMVGWMKLAGLPIPPEFAGPRRRSRDVETPRGESARCAAVAATATSGKRASDSRSAIMKATK